MKKLHVGRALWRAAEGFPWSLAQKGVFFYFLSEKTL